MKIEKNTAIRLPWKTVAQIVEKELETILSRKVQCETHLDDDTYWTIIFPAERISISELYKILESINADEEQRSDAVPSEFECVSSVKCLGMGTSRLLLSKHFGYQWEYEHLEETSLWLLGKRDGGTA